MAKGAVMTTQIKNLIAKIYLNDRSIKPTPAREKLLTRMKEIGLDKIFGHDYPSVSSVSKELTRIRNNDENRALGLKDLDKPWSVLSLADFPLPPEALPFALKAWAQALVSDKRPLTIRQANWIGRLYHIYSKDTDSLFRMVEYISFQEYIAQITENYQVNPQDTHHIWLNNLLLYLDLDERKDTDVIKHLLKIIDFTRFEIDPKLLQG